METIKKIFILLGSLDRRIIFLIVGLSVLIPLIQPEWVNFPIRPTPESQIVFDEINKLNAGDKILLSFEYGPSTKPEIHPMAIAILKHLYAKNIQVYGFALWPDGNFMSTEAFSEVSDDYDKKYGVDYVNLGYKPGGEAVIKGIASDIRTLYPVDLQGTSINDIPMMKDVVNIEDFDFVFSLSAGFPGSKEWVQYACDPKNIPLSTGCTSIQVTDIMPYVENDQIRGILAGMPGAAEYESLVEAELQKMEIAGKPGEASGMMAAQSIAHVVIVLFIIFGNISYFITRKKNRKG
ncbi:MAG TPA: hypothetical protein EYM76_04020 [Candidatus Marinimicrobia bacterium]|jgi:hypothetical protein|nr:hypothetical protein [Candidatus Neomarinimicrobiota bacterium]